MPTSHAMKCECAMTGEGVESQISVGGKRTPEFTEKNFVRLLIFFRLLFFSESPGPK
jgi:hypothetical protein